MKLLILFAGILIGLSGCTGEKQPLDGIYPSGAFCDHDPGAGNPDE